MWIVLTMKFQSYFEGSPSAARGGFCGQILGFLGIVAKAQKAD